MDHLFPNNPACRRRRENIDDEDADSRLPSTHVEKRGPSRRERMKQPLIDLLCSIIPAFAFKSIIADYFPSCSSVSRSERLAKCSQSPFQAKVVGSGKKQRSPCYDSFFNTCFHC